MRPSSSHHDVNQGSGRNAAVALRDHRLFPIATPPNDRCTLCTELLPCTCKSLHNIHNDFYVQGNYLAYQRPSLPSPEYFSNEMRGFRPVQNIGQYSQPRMLPKIPIPIRQLPNQNHRGGSAFASGASFLRQSEQVQQSPSLESLEKLFRAIVEMAERGAQESHIWRESTERARPLYSETMSRCRSGLNRHGGGDGGQVYSVDRPRPSAPVASPRSISAFNQNQLNYDLFRLNLESDSSSQSTSGLIHPTVPHLSYIDAARVRRERRNARRRGVKHSKPRIPTHRPTATCSAYLYCDDVGGYLK